MLFLQANELAPAGNREVVSTMTGEMQDREKPGEGSASIMSFKEIWITIGELDFQVTSSRWSYSSFQPLRTSLTSRPSIGCGVLSEGSPPCCRAGR